jgi:hypothetical protein
MASDPEAKQLYLRHLERTRPHSLVYDAELRSPGAGVELDVHGATLCTIVGGAPHSLDSMHNVRGPGVDDHRFLLRQDLSSAGDIWFEIQDKPTGCRHMAPFPAWQDFQGSSLKLIDWAVIPPERAEIRFAPGGTTPSDPACPTLPGYSILELTLLDGMWEPYRGTRALLWVETDPATARGYYTEHHLTDGTVRVLYEAEWKPFGGGWVATKRTFYDPSAIEAFGKSLRYSELVLDPASFKTHAIPEGQFDCPTLYGSGW